MTRYFIAMLVVAIGLFPAGSDAAAPSSATLLPATTKGYVSVPNPAMLREKWHQTELGQLVDDPVMKPFINDLKKQISSKLSNTRVRLGIALEDVDGIAGGEISLAVIQPGGDIKAHAMALLVDVTGHKDEVTKLLQKIDASLTQQGAVKRTETIEQTDVTVYTMPKKRPDSPQVEARYVLDRDLLVVSDNAGVIKGILQRLHGIDGPTLAKVEAYAATMKRCEKEEGGQTPQIRWFVDPFGYAYVVRAAAGGRKRRGADLLKVLDHQGFNAIKGVGGHVFFATGEYEIMHHTMIYAPPVPRAEGDKNQDRYNLAARMLQFPNSKNLAPQPWVFRNLGSYITFNFKMAEAFEYSKTLINEMMGAKKDQDLFEDMIGSLAEDKDGPQIDLRKDLIRYFGQRVSVLADCRRPITPDSERLMVAIELTNPEAVRKSVNRAMENDPDAKKRVFQDHIIWEILTEDAPAEVEPLQIEGGGFNPFPSDEPEAPEERERVLPNSAITVANGQLIVATHVDFIVELLQQPVGVNNLAEAADFQIVQDSLDKLGAGTDSFRFFTRTDEAYRTTYELIRQGKMPEAKSLLGKLLNRLLGPDEEGVLREQQIDGSKMPPFDAVRRYLGPAGMFVHSEDDGWFATGCLLSKTLQ